LESPHVVISDSPPIDSREVFVWRAITEQAHLLMWTHYRRESDTVRAVIAGATGLILIPDESSPGLAEIILKAAGGVSFIPQDTLTRLRAIASGVSLSRLDQQERMLLGCVVDRKRDAEIGLQLGLTDRQVSARVADILDKLQRIEAGD
jgi:DNA-binding NarL/FixJ family response regulator